MEVGETINAMYNNFNNIIIGLKGLVKVIEKVELNHKLLVSLHKEWHPRLTTIEEAKDLATMNMEQLLGPLITHECPMQMDKEDMEINKKMKNLAPNAKLLLF